MTLKAVLIAAFLVAGLGVVMAAPDQAAPDTEIVERLRALEDQVFELNKLLRTIVPPSPVNQIEPFLLPIANAPFRGSEAATVVVIEFSDFECPFCGRHAAGVYREIQQRFVDTGKVRYAFRHLPLEQIHPHARQAAEAAECARQQGRFWEYHDRLFAQQKSMTRDDLSRHANSVTLKVEAFESCLNEGEMAGRVAVDVAEVKRLGLTGTPVFMIGEMQKDGSARVTHKIVGSHPFAVYESVLNALLDKSH